MVIKPTFQDDIPLPNDHTILVNGVTQANSNNLNPLLILNVVRDNAQVIFSGASSTFNAITIQADNGVVVKTPLPACRVQPAGLLDHPPEQNRPPLPAALTVGVIVCVQALGAWRVSS